MMPLNVLERLKASMREYDRLAISASAKLNNAKLNGVAEDLVEYNKLLAKQRIKVIEIKTSLTELIRLSQADISWDLLILEDFNATVEKYNEVLRARDETPNQMECLCCHRPA